jgi:TrmH family RNA methyltransferase
MKIMVFISSPSNPRIRALQHLHASRGRKKSGLFLMEGPHLLQALLDAHLEPHEIYYQPELLQRTASGQKLLERLLHTANIKPEGLIEVSERVIEAISEAQTAQGVVCVLPTDAFTPEQARKRRSERKRPALLILDSLADPGNMGTILRTALAADVDEVLLTADCVDYYSPKVVRAAAGAHIALPVSDLSWTAIEERVKLHCPAELRVLLAEAGGSYRYYEQDFTRPFALIIGNEAHGPSEQARALATLSITIPLANQVESLNAAMAAGIILYEGVRQNLQ